jgi:hypothetical protein
VGTAFPRTRWDGGATSTTEKAMSKSAANFIHALVAVLAGNAAYFLLGRYLPSGARHVPFQIDLGLMVDLWFCVVVFGLIKIVAKWRRASNRPKG